MQIRHPLIIKLCQVLQDGNRYLVAERQGKDAAKSDPKKILTEVETLLKTIKKIRELYRSSFAEEMKLVAEATRDTGIELSYPKESPQEKLLDLNVIVDNEEIGWKETPLVSAMKLIESKESYDVIKLLLLHGANPAFASKETDFPLFEAIQSERVDVVQLLLEHKVDLNQRFLRRVRRTDNLSDIELPLHVALQNNASIQMIELLLNQGAKLELIDPDSLVSLLASQRPEVVKLLLSKKEVRDVIDHVSKASGFTALHTVCYRYLDPAQSDMVDNTPVLKLLLDAKADRNIKSITPNRSSEHSYAPGYTPLALAAAKDNWRHADLLIRAQADLNSVSDSGRTPFEIAIDNANSSVVPILLDADPSLIQRKGKNVWFSMSMIHNQSAHRRAETLEIIKILLERGLDVELKNEDGFTACDVLLTQYNHFYVLDMLSILFSKGAKIRHPSALLHLILHSDQTQDTAILTCLSELCRQQKDLRDTKADVPPFMLLDDAAYKRATDYLQKYQKLVNLYRQEQGMVANIQMGIQKDIQESRVQQHSLTLFPAGVANVIGDYYAPSVSDKLPEFRSDDIDNEIVQIEIRLKSQDKSSGQNRPSS